MNYPGIYGIRDYPTVKEVLQKVGVREETRTDVAYLTRTRLDGTRELIKFNPAEELAADTALPYCRKIRLPSSTSATSDKATVAIEGAVRQPELLP